MMQHNKKVRIAIWGLGRVGAQLARVILQQQDIELVAARVFDAKKIGQDIGQLIGAHALGLYATDQDDEILTSAVDCIIFTPSAQADPVELDAMVCRFLAAGIDVISTATHQDPVLRQRLDQSSDFDESKIRAACVQGRSRFHVTGLFPHLMLEKLAMTLSHALSELHYIRTVQTLNFAQAPADFWGGIQALGFGLTPDQFNTRFKQQKFSRHRVLLGVAATGFKLQDVSQLEVKQTLKIVCAKQAFEVHGEKIEVGTVQTIERIESVYYQDRCILKNEEYWCANTDELNYGENLPYGAFTGPYAYTVQVHGEPSLLDAQLEFIPHVPNANPLIDVTAQAILHAINALKDAPFGILIQNASPCYQIDSRVKHQPVEYSSFTSVPNKKYKVVIWGPGEIGGAVVRAALQRDNIQIVGAKVFSPHKHGQDLGVLVGIEPIGVRATTNKQDILDLDANCVIVTPQPRAIVEGLDDEVLEILAAGKNVISSAAYHNVTMPNWLNQAQTPTALMYEIADIKGLAKNKAEAVALKFNQHVTGQLQNGKWTKWLSPILDSALKPFVAKAMPSRATPDQILKACQTGNSSLHGTGVHPSFMAERIGVLLGNMLDQVRHTRFIEAVDFSYMPDGMWGGLHTIGFGRPIDELDESFIVAKAGDFYYGDVIGNVAHLLYGVGCDQVRVERHFSAISAKEDFKVGSTWIKKGHAAALHMVHKGYIGEHHFFTNEECWYLGPNQEYRGDDLPFGHFKTPISYTIDIKAKASDLRMQLSMDGTGRFAEILNAADISTADQRCTLGQVFRDEGVTNPITNATAMAILDAVEAVCELPDGIVIDQIKTHLKAI